MAFDVQSMLYSTPAIVLGLSVHEFAHAFAAYRLGDSTARDEGRLTLNPLKHLDPLGFLFLMIAGFGWAKPVRFSRERLRNPRRDEAVIALAGPVSNLLLAVIASLLLRILDAFFPGFMEARAGANYVALRVVLNFIFINYGLFVFNMIPLPPLDGSHLLFRAIAIKPEIEAKLQRYGSFALIAIILIENRTSLDLLPIGRLVRAMAQGLFGILWN